MICRFRNVFGIKAPHIRAIGAQDTLLPLRQTCAHRPAALQRAGKKHGGEGVNKPHQPDKPCKRYLRKGKQRGAEQRGGSRIERVFTQPRARALRLRGGDPFQRFAPGGGAVRRKKSRIQREKCPPAGGGKLVYQAEERLKQLGIHA